MNAQCGFAACMHILGASPKKLWISWDGQSTSCPYLDMPLQHISDSMLRRMRRGKGGESTLALLRRLRAAIPNLVLRTTFITGLPGETEEEFQELCEVVREIKFERMGVFVFSPEDRHTGGRYG